MSHVIPLAGIRICRLFPRFFCWYAFSGFARLKKQEELQNCAWNSEFALCRECNLTLFCLTAIYWETCLFICGFLIFRSPSLALALSVRVEWNRMAACMQGWVSSGQKIFYIQFLRLFPCFVLFFGLFVCFRQSWQFKWVRWHVLLLWISELWLLVVDVTIINYY